MADKPAPDFIPPAPAEQAAPPREPMAFETAKYCTAHYASVAANALGEYFLRSRQKPEDSGSLSGGQYDLQHALRVMAKKSYDAPDDKAWADAIKGRPTGSALIGSMHLARNVIAEVLKHDKTLPAGSEADACGTLTRHGLSKLRNGLNFSIAGIREHMPKHSSRHIPSMHMSTSGSRVSTASAIGTTLNHLFGITGKDSLGIFLLRKSDSTEREL